MKVIKPVRKIPHTNKDVFKEGSQVHCNEHIYTMRIATMENQFAVCEWFDNNGSKQSKEFNIFYLKIIV